MSSLLTPRASNLLSLVAVTADNLLTREDAGRLPSGTGGPIARGEAQYHTLLSAGKRQDGTFTLKDLLLEEVYEALALEGGDELRDRLIEISAIAMAWVTILEVRSPR